MVELVFDAIPDKVRILGGWLPGLGPLEGGLQLAVRILLDPVGVLANPGLGTWTTCPFSPGAELWTEENLSVGGRSGCTQPDGFLCPCWGPQWNPSWEVTTGLRLVGGAWTQMNPGDWPHIGGTQRPGFRAG